MIFTPKCTLFYSAAEEEELVGKEMLAVTIYGSQLVAAADI